LVVPKPSVAMVIFLCSSRSSFEDNAADPADDNVSVIDLFVRLTIMS